MIILAYLLDRFYYVARGIAWVGLSYIVIIEISKLLL